MIRNGGQLFLPENSTENGGKPQIRYYDNEQFANLALDEKTGASIDLSINTSTYVMTVALKNADGTIISSGNIDFPLESVVVNATYESGILTLVLQNGNSVNVDISDIISGLVAEDGDGSNLTASFTDSATRTNIATGEKLSVLFGKIKKWFTDLKSLAFKSKTEAGDYTAGSITSTDTDNTIAKTSDLSALVSDVQANGVSVVSDRVANITKSSLGLGNVNNTADVNKVVHGATVLTNQDLNNYKTTAFVGWYYAAGGNTVKNKPSGVGEFGLEVIRAANGVFVQRLTYGNKLYQRTYSGSSWNSWIEFANTTGTYSGMTVGKATNATKDGNGNNIANTYAKKAEISNPNLIINPDFSINQRVKGSYSGSNIYTVDRWKTYNNITFDVKTKTITNNETSAAAFLIQFSEDFNSLYGKTVALSCLIDNVRYSTSITISSSYSSNQVITNIGTSNAKFELGYNSTRGIFVQFRLAAGASAVVDECKLEIGSTATAFMPPLIAEELPKCQRYGFLLASGPVRYPNTQIEASIIDFTIPTPVSLRTPPTLSNTTNLVIYNPDSGMATQTGFTFSVVHTTSNAICIRATKSAHRLSRAVLGFSANIFLDAEIY